MQWQQDLRYHPDRRYTEFILQGIQEGFRVGFDNSQPLQPASSNLPTADSSITTECGGIPAILFPMGFIQVQ